MPDQEVDIAQLEAKIAQLADEYLASYRNAKVALPKDVFEAIIEKAIQQGSSDVFTASTTLKVEFRYSDGV